jgi:ankyrin repeat protein
MRAIGLQIIFVSATVALLLIAQPALAEKKDRKSTSSSSSSSGVTKAQGPPPFFLQDPADGLCLAGEEFKRCSVDTLFYVIGSPGSYSIVKRPSADEDASADQAHKLCLAKPSCADKDALKTQDVKVAPCTHCGAKQWNILGDSDTGYVLTEAGSGADATSKPVKLCLVREKHSRKAKMAPCDSQDIVYTPLQLQFASKADIQVMSSPTARMVGAAADGDKKTMLSILKDTTSPIDVNAVDWDGLTALIAAAASGHVDIVKTLIKDFSADVNLQDKDGITALMEASIMGHTKVVELLLQAGAEVDATTKSLVTALWLAAGENKVDVIKALIKKGAETTVTRVDGLTALMAAAHAGHVDAVKLLIQNGADIKATDKDGLTALMNAAEHGSVDVLRLIVDAANKDPTYLNQKSKTGFNALIIAAANGKTDAVKYLIKDAHADVSIVADNGVTAAMYAASLGHLDALKILVQDGKANIHSIHSNGGSALLEACTAGAADSIKYLISVGANVDAMDHDGVTPLMAVSSNGNVTALNYILDALTLRMNADTDALKQHVNQLSFSGGSAVMFAAAGGHVNATKILISLGADVNAIAQATPEYLEKIAKMVEDGTYNEPDPHVDGVTALHVAAQGGHLACVKVLLEAGADVSVKDDEDRDPMYLAVKGNHGEVVKVLVQAGSNPNMPFKDEDGAAHNLLMDSIIVENNDFSQTLIEKGADIYYQDENKITTLLQASHRGLTAIVRSLLEKHVSNDSSIHGTGVKWVDMASDEGISPLIAASSEGHLEVVQLLIEVGKADVNAKDKDMTNSLMAAAARGNTDIVEILIKAGALLNEQNIDGHTALMFAYNGKNQVETLWERYEQYVAEAKVERNLTSNSDGSADANIDDGGTGTIIKEALDKHKKMVEVLLKNGADPSIKDKEGHVAIDFDFHPDTDSAVLKQEENAERKRDESKNEL